MCVWGEGGVIYILFINRMDIAVSEDIIKGLWQQSLEQILNPSIPGKYNSVSFLIFISLKWFHCRG